MEIKKAENVFVNTKYFKDLCKNYLNENNFMFENNYINNTNEDVAIKHQDDKVNFTLEKEDGALSNSIYKINFKDKKILLKLFSNNDLSNLINRKLEIEIYDILNKTNEGIIIYESDYKTYVLEEYLIDYLPILENDCIFSNLNNVEKYEELIFNKILNFNSINCNQISNKIININEFIISILNSLDSKCDILSEFSLIIQYIKVVFLDFNIRDNYTKKFNTTKNNILKVGVDNLDLISKYKAHSTCFSKNLNKISHSNSLINKSYINSYLNQHFNLSSSENIKNLNFNRNNSNINNNLFLINKNTYSSFKSFIKVLSHNDLHYGNIMINKYDALNIKLIDYEYSCFNYIGFDIANFFLESLFDFGYTKYPYYQLKEDPEVLFKNKKYFKKFICFMYNYSIKNSKCLLFNNFCIKNLKYIFEYVNMSDNKLQLNSSIENEYNLYKQYYFYLLALSSALWSLVALANIKLNEEYNKESFSYYNYTLDRIRVFNLYLEKYLVLN